MTLFEVGYLCAERFLPPLHGLVRERLKRIAAAAPQRLEILDVGGRKSHYSIGVPGTITVSDLARESTTQKQLHLGLTPDMVESLRRRRSNLRQVIIDDMTRSGLPDQSFDCVVSVEVLEHVRDASSFVRHVHRVLKPGGVFLMTTPNADHPGRQGMRGPDDEHYYTQAELARLLANQFEEVEIEYAILVGKYHTLGLRAWSLKRPLQTVISMTANLINRSRSRDPSVRNRARGTRHLVALARKRAASS